MRHTRKEDVLELDFKLLLLCLLHPGNVDEEKYVHVLVLEMHIPTQTVDLSIKKSDLRIFLLSLRLSNQEAVTWSSSGCRSNHSSEEPRH